MKKQKKLKQPSHETQTQLQASELHNQSSPPVLRFTPTAWAKLMYFRDHGETEIGGFGISNADDLLLIEDFATIKQEASIASVSFDDESIADFFDTQVDQGRRPEQFCRIWLHTHPGNSPSPSGTDEETFARVFGRCQWALMFIIAMDNNSYARLRFNVGPGGEVEIPVEIDYSQAFSQSEQDVWEAEFKANIIASQFDNYFGSRGDFDFADVSGYSCPDDWLEELESMDPCERRQIFDELAARPDLWDQEEVVHVG